jgi:hypothetical protein
LSSFIPNAFAARILGAGGKAGLQAARSLGAGAKTAKVAEVTGGALASGGAQAATSGGVELSGQLLAGTPLDQALREAKETAIIFGTADFAGPIVATTVGKTIGAVRDMANWGRKKMRVARGLKPTMEVDKIRSISHPFGEESGFLKPRATEVIETIREVGGVPRPGSVVRHSLVDTVQQIVDTAFTSRAGAAETLKQTNKRLFVSLRQAVNSMPRLGRRDVGELLQDIVTGRLTRIKGVAQAHFRIGDKIAGSKMKTVTREIVEEIPVLGLGGKPIVKANGTPQTRTVTRTVEDLVPEFGGDIGPMQTMAARMLKTLQGGTRNNPGMEKFLQGLIDKPRVQTISAMAQMRSELFEKSQQFALGAGDVIKADKAMSKGLTTPLTRAMNQAMDSAPAEAREAYTAARKLWKEEIRGDLTQAYISKLANNQSDDVLDAILVSGNPGEIDMIRNIVMKENPAAWEAVQGEYLQRMFYRHGERVSFAGQTEVIGMNGKSFIDDLTTQAGSDGAVLKSLFPHEFSKGGNALKNVRKYAQALATQTSKDAAAGGAIFMQMGQAGAVGIWMGWAAQSIAGDATTTISAGALGAGAGYLITPHLMGRMFKNDEIVDWLIKGAKHSPGTVMALRATIAVTGFLLQDKIFNSNEENRGRAANQKATAEAQLKERVRARLF